MLVVTVTITRVVAGKDPVPVVNMVGDAFGIMHWRAATPDAEIVDLVIEKDEAGKIDQVVRKLDGRGMKKRVLTGFVYQPFPLPEVTEG